jgi:hypothetical protein
LLLKTFLYLLNGVVWPSQLGLTPMNFQPIWLSCMHKCILLLVLRFLWSTPSYFFWAWKIFAGSNRNKQAASVVWLWNNQRSVHGSQGFTIFSENLEIFAYSAKVSNLGKFRRRISSLFCFDQNTRIKLILIISKM